MSNVVDDDDVSAMWREHRAASQEKRASNRDRSAALLQEAGIQFVSKNGGAHLIVAERYDFWPGTGLWMARGDKSKSRGVKRLIQRIKGNRD